MYERDAVVLAKHQRLVATIRSRVTKYAQTQWAGLTTWNDADVARLVAQVVPVVELGQKQVGQLTNSYLARLAGIAGIGKTEPVAPVLWARNADPAEVYSRPAKEARWAYSTGKTPDEANAAGSERMASLIDIDMQLAESNTARSWMESNGVAGYRRVLTGAENCALCVLASTQRYHRSDLKAIHRFCDCKVAPIYGTHDPGLVINPDRYDAIHAEVKDQLGAQSYDGISNGDYRKIMVREHGEYGATLTWRGQNFTGPDDI